MRYIKENPWQVITIIFGLLLIVSIFTNGFNTLNISNKDKIANKAINFINTDLLQGQATATLNSVISEKGLYKLNVKDAQKRINKYVKKTPVVEIRDFESNALEYEIYSYGEETTVVPVTIKKSSPLEKLAAIQVENMIKRIASDAEVEMVSEHKVNVYVPEDEIARVIGKNGETIKELEKRLGMSINVESLQEESEEGKEVHYDVAETKKTVIFNVESSLIGKMVTGYSGNMYLFSTTVGKHGEVRINKKGKLGKNITALLDKGQRVELRI